MKRTETYGNILVKAPDDTDLFKCSQDRADWYLKRKLAEVIQEDPMILRLTFTPGGKGNSGDPFYFQTFKNICVACGSEEELSLHHIFPLCYRKFLPQDVIDRIAKHNMYDMKLLCEDCHSSYEVHATELKKELAKKHDIPYYGVWLDMDKEKEYKNVIRVKKYCYALFHYGDKIPEEKKDSMINAIRKLLNNPDITLEGLKQLSMISGEHKPDLKASELVVRKIIATPDDLDNFIIMWRKHFLEHMKPKFMPSNWDVERKTCQLRNIEKIWD